MAVTGIHVEHKNFLKMRGSPQLPNYYSYLDTWYSIPLYYWYWYWYQVLVSEVTPGTLYLVYQSNS